MAFRTFDRLFVITAVETLADTVQEVIHSHPQADKIFATAELEWLKIAYMAVSVRESSNFTAS
jgi:hypothetical protein